MRLGMQPHDAKRLILSCSTICADNNSGACHKRSRPEPVFFGVRRDGAIEATALRVKSDGNYMPPDVARALEQAQGVQKNVFTRLGKGRDMGPIPIWGGGGFSTTNSVVMIAFQDEAPLAGLIETITAANVEIKRPADRIRLFQLPLDRVV